VIYLDSTYIIKCYLNEPGSREVLELVQGHDGQACALHGRVEFWSGVKRHVREGGLPPQRAQEVLLRFIRDESAGIWLFLPVDEALVRTACMRLAALPGEVSCRAADALHLASAADDGFTQIYSNDRHVLLAAPHFGLEGVNVIPF
jgi:predicted nucleic acid-binding protein